MISFGIKYGFLFLLIVLAGAAGVVAILYLRSRDSRELNRWQQGILVTLRYLSVALIAFLLLSPFLKSLKRIVQRPLIITAWDNSASMLTTADSLDLIASVNSIRSKVSEALGSSFTLVDYTFGETVTAGGDLRFTERKSDYSMLFSTLANNHFNEHVGALILAGDGIANQGMNPVNQLDQTSFPVYTIGYGDTVQVTDAGIRAVRVNRTSFTGNRFPVEIDVHFHLLRGRSLKLSVHEGDQELVETVIAPTSNDFFITEEFMIDAGAPGLKHYTVSIESDTKERNTQNNRSLFVVNVLENRQKIVILSDGPHPDIGVIKTVLDQDKSYEVSVYTEAPYPSNLQDYNLIILNQLPTTGSSMAAVLNERAGKRTPLLWLVGDKTFLPQFNALIPGVQIDRLAETTEDVQAIVNPAYATFTLSESSREMIPQFPPLKAPFANYQLNPQFNTLLYQRVKNVETGNPLLATAIIDGRKTGIIFGEGIWKWRLNNYLRNQTHDQINELVCQLIRYLALRPNEDNFMISFEPVYAEVDDIIMQAEVYNDAFEKISNNEVTIEIDDEQNNRYEFTFDVRNDNYHLNAGKLPVGNYQFKAKVTIGEDDFFETGRFTVTALNMEELITMANHQMLFQLASLSNGIFCRPEQTDEIIQALKAGDHLKPVSYFQEMINEILNLKWIFFVILFLLSMEWFLRKFWGIY